MAAEVISDINGVQLKVFCDRGVQCLAFNDGKNDCSIGVVMPGNHDFGEAETDETITVTSGHITIHGLEYPTTEGHATCPIKKGERIVFYAKEWSTYYCKKNKGTTKGK
jgi:uncharacterized protein YaiE (UPF0345 family)